MAIQLKEAPNIKISLRSGDLFSEVAPNFVIESFKLTKKLLEPNCFVFEVSKDELDLEDADFKFDLRDQLLGAKVECSLTAIHYGDDEQDEEDTEDFVEYFFFGFIQNIKVLRKGVRTPTTFRCTAYSPDSRLKQFPTCSSRVGVPLAKYVSEIIYGPSEYSCKFDVSSGRYEDPSVISAIIKPRHNDNIPYTVQYHESGYDFLVRLAKRYGEFFYYEDGLLYFGEMEEYEPIHMRTGIDLEKYYYDINMNDHLGTVLAEFDYIDRGMERRAGRCKWSQGGWKQRVESPHEMAQSAFNQSMEYFNDEHCMVSDLHSSRILKEPTKRDFEKNDDVFWADEQYTLLEQYVMADCLICDGVARRAVLKLGSVIVIEDETYSGPSENSDVIEHEPLKVIEVYYEWNSNQGVLNLVNRFKAIPQKMQVPPYLVRDKYGFLTYGDFDIFPYSGPQHGRVVDNNDPLGLGRVQVVMSWQYQQEVCNDQNKDILEMKDNRTPWIRVAQPYGGHERGSYLVPEIRDEVIVGFEHNNAERPYVAGVVHNNWNDKVDAQWVEEGSVKSNEYKAFRTRNGHTIEIRDKDENGYIKIYDNKTHNYVVTLDTDSKKITLESRGNIELSADNNIVLNAKKNIVVNAGEKFDGTANEFDFVVKDWTCFSSGNYRFNSNGQIAAYASSHIILKGGMSDLDDFDSFKTGLSLDKEEVQIGFKGATNSSDNYICISENQVLLEALNSNAEMVLHTQYNDIKLKADTMNIEITSGNNMTINPLFDLKLKGMTLKTESFASVSIEGTMTQIKGTPLKLN